MPTTIPEIQIDERHTAGGYRWTLFDPRGYLEYLDEHGITPRIVPEPFEMSVTEALAYMEETGRWWRAGHGVAAVQHGQ